ncbi:caldesmon [Pectinophora gossypiella]|uniref:Uncharacterized protein n=1 Tax=Pectinophora gossypiella TaxID=13191 RepID=A0A1E1W419_PECGO|nr:caldesmon [Pectinophora gossypiella]
MSFHSGDWRGRRGMLHQGVPLGPMHYSIANYSTDSMKSDITLEENILTKIHSIPDPLKKNLADTVITPNNNKEKKKTMSPQTKEVFYDPQPPSENMAQPPNGQRHDFYQPFMGITNFISNFFGAISGAMFNRRARSPVSQYYDCFECDSHMDQEMSPEGWQAAKSDDQNKTIAPEVVSTESNDNMNNCKSAAAHCEDKLNSVRCLLTTKTVSSAPKLRPRRPRRVFVEPGSIEDNYEDEFVANNLVSLANEEYIEYFPLANVHKQEFTEVDAAKMKTEIISAPESTDIVKVLKDVNEKPEVIKVHNDVNDMPTVVNNVPDVNDNPKVVKTHQEINTKPETNPTVIEKLESEIDSKKQIISSCEDKMAKLKSLLLEKRKKPIIVIDSIASAPEPEPVIGRPPIPTKVIPIEKTQDKHFKNPNRLTDKRRKSRIRKNIQDDMLFAQEIDSGDISSVDSSPVKCCTKKLTAENTPTGSVDSDKEYFDELKGRFHSNSTTDSDDSFQIVFTDSPKHSRVRQPSDCDSEDSFIVFEESPDSCYTSNDVFGDDATTDDSDNECSDSDSEISDSGCGTGVCQLSHKLSRTISDLTDDSLYEDSKSHLENTGSSVEMSSDCASDNDEVDCAVRTFDEIPSQDVDVLLESDSVKRGLLIDENKKLRKKGQPPKRVSFSEKPPKVHVMRVWTFAARQARAGHWERHALDRERFKRRIADVDMAVSWVLKPQHRSRVMFQRFMPWWNAQKRKEAAEKKQREEEEKIRKEQERMKEEEERIKNEQESAQRELEGDKSVEEGSSADDNKIESGNTEDNKVDELITGVSEVAEVNIKIEEVTTETNKVGEATTEVINKIEVENTDVNNKNDVATTDVNNKVTKVIQGNEESKNKTDEVNGDKDINEKNKQVRKETLMNGEVQKEGNNKLVAEEKQKKEDGKHNTSAVSSKNDITHAGPKNQSDLRKSVPVKKNTIQTKDLNKNDYKITRDNLKRPKNNKNNK